MAGEINVSGSGDSSQPNILKKVQAKQEEIKNNSVFQALTKGEGTPLLNETAFLMTIFDKNNDGMILTDEVNNITPEEIDAQVAEYNSQSEDDLNLESGKRTIDEFLRKIGLKGSEKDFITALRVSAQADANIRGEKVYFDAAKKVDELEKKGTLSDKDQMLLYEAKRTIELQSYIMSPEVLKSTQDSVKINLEGEK